MSTPETASSSRFRFVVDWPAPEVDAAEAIRAFWLKEGAFGDDSQIGTRVQQVVMHAYEGDDIAAVCTAVAMTPPAFGQPVYYYRSFVGKRWRSTMLVWTLLARAQACLADYARARDFPCIGVLLELENARFRTRGRGPIWPHTEFIYVGKSPRGLDTRVSFFKGAMLKDPK